MRKNLALFSFAIALPLACTTTPKEVAPVDTSATEVRLLRVDPVDGTETHVTGQFVVRVINSGSQAVQVKRISLEANFSDELQVAPAPAQVDPDAETEQGEEDDGEPGSGGDTDDEVDVFDGELTPGLTIGAGEQKDFSVPIRLDFPEQADQYVAFCRLGIAHLDIEGVVETSAGRQTVEDNLEIPTPALPEPQAIEVQIASSNGGENGDLSMALRIFNANVFSYKIRDWRYKIYVAGKLMREAEVGTGERIRGNTAVQYDISIPLNTETFGPEITNILRGQSVSYRVTGELRFLDVTLPTEISGEVDFSR